MWPWYWRMTLKSNRAPLLSNIKLLASFHHHMWIQTGVTVRKRLSWVLTCDLDLWPWPFAWTLHWSLVITPENFMMIRWWEQSTRRSENDNTPQPLDQWTNSPFIGQQVGNCKSFTLIHYLADLFAMHRGPRSIPLCIQHHIQLTSLSFRVSRPSHS